MLEDGQYYRNKLHVLTRLIKLWMRATRKVMCIKVQLY